MTGSRCLQCGAQLPVFRKFTGSGDFCSDAHRQTYQQEMNRIALSRLMKAKPRQEETAVPANGRAAAPSTPVKPAEPAVPAAAGFMPTNLAGLNGYVRRTQMEEPLPAAATLVYPERAAREIDDLETLLGDPATVGLLTSGLRPSTAPSPTPLLAQRIPITTCVEMSLTTFELRCDPAPAESGGPEIYFGAIAAAILRTTGFNFEEEEATREPVPPHFSVPLEIAIQACEPAQPGIVQSFESIPASPFRPQMPVLELLPLRPAITFAAPPKPVEERAAANPSSKHPTPRPVMKAAPAPAERKKTARPNVEKDPASVAPDAQSRPSKRAPASDAEESSLRMSSSLTLGMPSSDMGSPIFRFWYSTPVKLKVTIVTGLLAIVIFSALSKSAGESKISPTAGLAPTAPLAGFAGGAIAMGSGGWTTGWAGDSAGAKRGKQLTLYTPSMRLRDYRTEFAGQIESRSLGWVFRASDSKNYYAMKVRIVRPGIEPGIVLTRYAVVNGLEGPHVDVPLDLTVRNDTIYKVRVDVQGPSFTTYLQGKAIDIWSDDRLKSGGFGFSNERGERAHIRSVSVSF